MDTNEIMHYAMLLMLGIGVLVIVTNIIVEVLKQITWKHISTNVLAVIVALILTVAVFLALMAYFAIAIQWYYVAAAVVVAFMVAYAAMFGYDKLLTMLFEKFREIWMKLKTVKLMNK